MILMILLSCILSTAKAQTEAQWFFDEPVGLYPSSVMEDNSKNDYPLVLGLGGEIVPGKFGNCLQITDIRNIKVPRGLPEFGLMKLPIPKGSYHTPLYWGNAFFAGLMTSGEKHLRNQVGFANATDTKLNFGMGDFTISFWLRLDKVDDSNRTVLEIGTGPLMEKNTTTTLSIGPDGTFYFYNMGKVASLKGTNVNKLNTWYFIALVYQRQKNELTLFANGKFRSKQTDFEIDPLPHGNEAYFSIGRNGLWKNPLNGSIDELKISSESLYTKNFEPPLSENEIYKPGYKKPSLKITEPLLFNKPIKEVVNLGNRKHLFIDNSLIEKMGGLTFNVNPPLKTERVIDHIGGSFRKHLTVVQDDSGLIRIYNGSVNDYLAVFTSQDGIHFDAPDMNNGNYEGIKNIVIAAQNGGLGNPFIDENGPPAERWKYISDYKRRGVYLYTSPDGYKWNRQKTALLPFRSGSQSCTFYDDQRGMYVSYHRSDVMAMPDGSGIRSSVVTQTNDLYKPIPFNPISQEKYYGMADSIPLRRPLPWFMDNGPLTPGGFGLEFPHRFDPVKADPSGTDIYITKAQKYPWAPDTYLAFPVVYFHYEDAENRNRSVLGEKKYGRGSGPLETQLAVSRDGLNWQRMPRPVYVGIGPYLGRDIKTAYIADGMVRRGNEIWQYFFGETQYHSPIIKDTKGRGVYRLVQRLDGFVSVNSPYDHEATLLTKPFTFKGNTLVLNIDTDAAGYAQVGFLDEKGKSVSGFSLDSSIYINGDFVDAKASWLGKGTDVSALQGKTVQLQIRMRGSRLFAIQFTDNKTDETLR
ncbi:MAG: LamG domain-containing protein [Ginsengibacter sp.]